MGARDAITQSFRDLLTVKPYGMITISEICDNASTSRKSFYRHFECREDVLRAMVYDDLCLPLKSLISFLPVSEIKSAPLILVERTFLTIFSNRGCYENLVTHFGRMQLAEVLLTVLNVHSLEMIASATPITIVQEFDTYFDSGSLAMSIIWWIDRDMDITYREMAKMYTKRLYARWQEMDNNKHDWYQK
jgi:AcrR family transcriptional regulator